MDQILYIDFETRSPVDLKKHGLGVYARHPQTEVICMAYALGDSKPAMWWPGNPFPLELQGKLVVAHNAAFELALWNHVMRKRHGWPALRIEQTRCTMAMCYAMALPGALENAALALGLVHRKDTEGRALMLRMCKPYAWSEQGLPVYRKEPADLERLGVYCASDVEVEREIYKRVLKLTAHEQAIWNLDQVINVRGTPFDMDSLHAALGAADIEKERLHEKMNVLTGGEVPKCSQIAALKEFAADYGVMPDSLAKAELSDLLDETLPEVIRKALLLRQESSRFTSISKLEAIDNRHIDGRVSYVVQYHAATTGRWGGRGIQPHNFTRDLPEPAIVEDVLARLRAGDAAGIDMMYGPVSTMISQCLRGFIYAQGDNVLMGGDYANVEGRGLAWSAGEQWKLDAFRAYDAGTGPDLYKLAYSKSFGVPVENVTKIQRQAGKVQELAFGYQGGVGAARTMAKAVGVNESDDTYDSWKHAWRDAHPRTKAYWYTLQDAAIAAVLSPGTKFHAGAAGRQVTFIKSGSFLWCRLPSGRNLCYPYPKIGDDPTFGDFLSFKGQPTDVEWAIYRKQKEDGATNTTSLVDAFPGEPANTKEWCRMSTYGGKLAENITQALCRDILADALLRVDAAGFKIVLHVHDEIIVEGKFTEQDRLRFQGLMQEIPVWAKDFPIAAACWLSKRYVKE